jgi:trigger factor
MQHNPLGKDFAEKVMRAREGEQVRFIIDTASGSPEEKKPSVHLEVTLKSVRRKELPPFDDDFAASLNPKITSTDALKEDLHKQLTARAASSARRKMHNHLIDALLREEDFPVPPQMLDDYLNRLITDSRGDNGEQDAEKDKAFKEELHAVGVRNVRWFLLRQVLIRVHELKASEEDLEREFEILSKMSGKSLDEIKATYADKDKRSDLLEAVTDRNIFAFLEKQITVVPVPVDLATFEGRAPGRIIAP